MEITKQSTITGKFHTRDLPITKDQLDRWNAGELIQDVMPELSASDRGFLISGSTDKEWNDNFKEAEGDVDLLLKLNAWKF